MNQHRNGFTFIGVLFSTISNWVSILSYVGISFSVFILFVKKNWYAIIFLLFFVIIRIAFIICFKYRDNIIKWILRLFAPNSAYYYSRWESVYEYKSLNKMAFHTRYHVRAMQNGVKYIRVRFNWSGETESNPIHPKPAKTDGCTTKKVEHSGDEFGYKYYNVFNKTEFNKGDPDGVKLGVDIENMNVIDKAVSHHLLTSVNVVTEKLYMKVIFPENIFPEDVVAHEFLHATDDNHWRDRSSECKIERQDEGKWIISWEVVKPVYGGKYIIFWEPAQIKDEKKID